MDSRESIASLYSALIAAGATIFALVGAFLLPLLTQVKSTRKVRAEAWKRLFQNTDVSASAATAAPGSVLTESPTPVQARPGDEWERLEARLREERDSQLELFSAALLAITLIGACILAPAIGLWTLHADQRYLQRSFVCIFGFGLALIGIPIALVTSVWPIGDASAGSIDSVSLIRTWGRVLNFIVAVCFIYVVFVEVNWPSPIEFFR